MTANPSQEAGIGFKIMIRAEGFGKTQGGSEEYKADFQLCSYSYVMSHCRTMLGAGTHSGYTLGNKTQDASRGANISGAFR